jgi:hypothetical protein
MTDIKIDIAAFRPFAQGKLKTTGQLYEIGILPAANAAEMKAFHDYILKRLAKDEKSFFLDKSLSFFEKLYTSGGTGGVIGIVCEGKLIAQAAITHPTKADPYTGMTDIDMKAIGEVETVSILQAVGVLPEMRGNNLMERLIDGWIGHATALGRTHVMAEVDTRNIASWNSFLKGGLDLAGMGVDPSDGSTLYNVHEKIGNIPGKKLRPLFNRASGAEIFVCRLDNVEKQQDLFAAGYKGVAVHKASASILFRKDKAPKP